MSAPLMRAFVLLLFALVLVSGYWLWTRLLETAGPQPAGTTPTATATRTPTAIPTTVKAPPGYRLAGVAVGEPESFAVVETAAGTSGLYRVGADVPGLGRLLRIEAERIVVQSEAGQFDLWLAPAATATPTRSPTAGTPGTQRTPMTTPRPQAPGGGRSPGSTP
jgi:hypothetical protein